MAQPTEGRVMYYRPTDAERLTMPTVPGRPLAMIVAAVQSDKYVNLGGFDANGCHFHKTSVPVFQTEADGPAEGGFVHWMPYQLAQEVRHASDPTYAPVAAAVSGAIDLSTKVSPSNG